MSFYLRNPTEKATFSLSLSPLILVKRYILGVLGLLVCVPNMYLFIFLLCRKQRVTDCVADCSLRTSFL